jgi:hypothetical protein
MVIEKALQEENPEKKQGFANNIAYYKSKECSINCIKLVLIFL